MYRPRLRTRTGCNQCKKRAKKCDEHKPECDNCRRIGLQCRWGSGRVTRQPHLIQLKVQELPDSSASVPIGDTPPSDLPTGGDSGNSTSGEDDNVVAMSRTVAFGGLDSAQQFLASNTAFARRFDVHVLFMAVQHGWDTVGDQFELDPQWQFLAHVDATMVAGGTAPPARFAALWVARRVTKLFASLRARVRPDVEHMPGWLTPLDCQFTTIHPAIFDLWPWPAAREKVVREQFSFCTAAFIRDFCNSGWNFTWPSAFDSAHVLNSRTGMLEASPAFHARLMDLNSYTMDKDVLDIYPSLRGRVPQTEPSITNLALTFRPEQFRANTIPDKAVKDVTAELHEVEKATDEEVADGSADHGDGAASPLRTDLIN